jgi:hypothetical protein
MFYLAVTNLGVERCIHRNEKDVYKDGMIFSCEPDLGSPKGKPVREIGIFCSEAPGSSVKAMVYRS